MFSWICHVWGHCAVRWSGPGGAGKRDMSLLLLLLFHVCRLLSLMLPSFLLIQSVFDVIIVRFLLSLSVFQVRFISFSFAIRFAIGFSCGGLGLHTACVGGGGVVASDNQNLN